MQTFQPVRKGPSGSPDSPSLQETQEIRQSGVFAGYVSENLRTHHRRRLEPYLRKQGPQKNDEVL
jgi:hypothetical protein